MITDERKIQLQRLAIYIFENSVGSAFWSDDYSRLQYNELGTYDVVFETETIKLVSVEECEYVLGEVHDMCDMCAYCGWIWWIEDMDESSGELVCTSCKNDEEE